MRIFTVVGLLFVSSIPAQAQTAITVARTAYGAAAAPRAIASADFNRDGWLDLATAGTGRDSIAILLNNGSHGGFRPLSDRVVGGGPFDLAAADLNHDSIPDLAIANADADAVDILLGAGDGTFGALTRIAMPAANPRGIALADFNGDGHVDIIVTEFATGAWRVLYGNGRGGIARQNRFGAIRNPQGVLVADFNRDGRADVAIAGAGINLVALFYSQPHGGIEQHNITVGTAVNVLAAGDFNHDGWLDLAAASSGASTIFTLHGGPAGLAYTADTPSASSPRGLVAIDINQDGWLDLITANRASSTVNVHLGIPSQPGRFSGPQLFAAAAGSRAVAAGDFDHDGGIDLATADEYASSVTVLSNAMPFPALASRFALRQFSSGPNRFGSQKIALADFDRDGRLDVVAATETSLILRPNGRSATIVDADLVRNVVVADFNGDGAADLAVGEDGVARLLIFLNRGDGTFAAPRALALPDFVIALAASDFNGDGRADVAVEYFDEDRDGGLLRVLLGRGDGTFAVAGTRDTNIRAAFNLVVGDFDRDGRSDIATNGITIWYGKGDGTPERLVFDESLAGYGVLAAGDLNEDGRLDLMTIGVEQPIRVWLALPAGGFAAGIDYRATLNETDSFVDNIAVGDINLDGHVDVITNEADILFGDGTGSLTLSRQSAFDWLGESPLVADYNGDGAPDLLFAQTDGFTVLLGRHGAGNIPPTVDAGPDLTVAYLDFLNGNPSITARGADADVHELGYEWRDGNGQVVSTDPVFFPHVPPPPGAHTFTVTVDDGRGGRASDSMVLTVTPYEEIVFYSDRFVFMPHGGWRQEADAAAATGVLMRHPDRNAPKLATPAARPVNYVEYMFAADPTQAYKLWLRLRADGDHWENDSVFVQFDGAVDAVGNPVYQIGTTSALAINLEECAGCGVSNWGWEDDGWGARNRTSATRLRFPTGFATIRIQTREDGVSFDQITLSARKYLTSRPGTATNDTTILPLSVR